MLGHPPWIESYTEARLLSSMEGEVPIVLFKGELKAVASDSFQYLSPQSALPNFC